MCAVLEASLVYRQCTTSLGLDERKRVSQFDSLIGGIPFSNVGDEIPFCSVEEEIPFCLLLNRCRTYFLFIIAEKARRPAASFGTIPTCKNPIVTPLGIEPGKPGLGTSMLTTIPPLPHVTVKMQYVNEYAKFADLLAMGCRLTSIPGADWWAVLRSMRAGQWRVQLRVRGISEMTMEGYKYLRHEDDGGPSPPTAVAAAAAGGGATHAQAPPADQREAGEPGACAAAGPRSPPTSLSPEPRERAPDDDSLEAVEEGGKVKGWRRRMPIADTSPPEVTSPPATVVVVVGGDEEEEVTAGGEGGCHYPREPHPGDDEVTAAEELPYPHALHDHFAPHDDDDMPYPSAAAGGLDHVARVSDADAFHQRQGAFCLGALFPGYKANGQFGHFDGEAVDDQQQQQQPYLDEYLGPREGSLSSAGSRGESPREEAVLEQLESQQHYGQRASYAHLTTLQPPAHAPSPLDHADMYGGLEQPHISGLHPAFQPHDAAASTPTSLLHANINRECPTASEPSADNGARDNLSLPPQPYHELLRHLLNSPRFDDFLNRWLFHKRDASLPPPESRREVSERWLSRRVLIGRRLDNVEGGGEIDRSLSFVRRVSRSRGSDRILSKYFVDSTINPAPGRHCGPRKTRHIAASSETDLLTNSQCDDRAEHLPRRWHRGANPRPSDYNLLPLSYEGRAFTYNPHLKIIHCNSFRALGRQAPKWIRSSLKASQSYHATSVSCVPTISLLRKVKYPFNPLRPNRVHLGDALKFCTLRCSLTNDTTCGDPSRVCRCSQDVTAVGGCRRCFRTCPTSHDICCATLVARGGGRGRPQQLFQTVSLAAPTGRDLGRGQFS
ncbi:hypothetical protein PR048_028071 [Dryococelus australis]|uniref:Uncharacterized protein n=1 Tax=Dryococelus australis TaxID=614101 RepID=A0ABQ9GI86_9NEOP|nr:hypothetical protein PR048_028071 [Dryococelus australis]